MQALKAAGNRVITLLAGRTKELIILEKEMRAASDEVIIMTDDGSYGEKGIVTAGRRVLLALASSRSQRTSRARFSMRRRGDGRSP